MSTLPALFDRLEVSLGARTFRIIRYLLSGGTAAATNIITLFLIVHFAQVYYLYATILAFAFSIIVSFTMQKFWTFRDLPMHDAHQQFMRYLLVIGANLALNTALMYVLVETAGMWYLSAQLLTTAIIAIIGYFGYRHFVFRERS